MMSSTLFIECGIKYFDSFDCALLNLLFPMVSSQGERTHTLENLFSLLVCIHFSFRKVI